MIGNASLLIHEKENMNVTQKKEENMNFAPLVNCWLIYGHKEVI